MLLALAAVSGCDSSIARITAADHEALVLEWREGRLERLKAEDGYLNLAGLFWLNDEAYTFGSGEQNDLRFPDVAANSIGTFQVSEEGVLMQVNPGADVRYEGVPVTSLFLSDDTTDNPVTITHRSLAWLVIQRMGRFGIRLRDFEHPLLDSFPPLQYFPISQDYRVEGSFQPYAEPRIIQVDTVVEGLGWEPESPGVVTFELAGEPFELEAYASGERLFFVFGDTTSGRETYPAGRFLYAEAPNEDGVTVLDFNLSYNPPCAFSEFSTCPVATPRNRLKTDIIAGELYKPGELPDFSDAY
ncbi:MAG: DUF1684 domain-containing protein [Woeseiaceae bacterium]|nr:DUF1684 domain-containing protein [Woeseiaceae bacterium]